MAAYQQILSLLPNIRSQQMLALRQVLHDANGQVRNLSENFGGQLCVGVPQFGLDQGSFIPAHHDPQGFQGGQQNPPILLMYLPRVRNG